MCARADCQIAQNPDHLILRTDWSEGRGLPAQPPRSLIFPGLAEFVAIARVRAGRPNPYGDGNDDGP